MRNNPQHWYVIICDEIRENNLAERVESQIKIHNLIDSICRYADVMFIFPPFADFTLNKKKILIFTSDTKNFA